MEILRHRPLHWISQQHDQPRLGQQPLDAARRLGMKQVVGSDLAAALIEPGASKLGAIPRHPCGVVEAEVVQLLRRRQIHPGVLLQQPLQRGGAPFLHPQPEKIRQPAAHTLRLLEGPIAP